MRAWLERLGGHVERGADEWATLATALRFLAVAAGGAICCVVPALLVCGLVGLILRSKS